MVFSGASTVVKSELEKILEEVDVIRNKYRHLYRPSAFVKLFSVIYTEAEVIQQARLARQV